MQRSDECDKQSGDSAYLEDEVDLSERPVVFCGKEEMYEQNCDKGEYDACYKDLDG